MLGKSKTSIVSIIFRYSHVNVLYFIEKEIKALELHLTGHDVIAILSKEYEKS